MGLPVHGTHGGLRRAGSGQFLL